MSAQNDYQLTNHFKMPPLLKRYPVPIYPSGVGLGPNGLGPNGIGSYGVGGYNMGPYGVYPPWTYAPGSLVRYDVLGTTYGNCDCSISSGYPKTNNCQAGGFPVCVPGGCTCYNPILGNAGCFDERGSTC